MSPLMYNYRWGCTSVVVAQAYAGDFAYGTKD